MSANKIDSNIEKKRNNDYEINLKGNKSKIKKSSKRQNKYYKRYRKSQKRLK